MNANTKIQLTDTVTDVMVKMSEGNPGALTVCIELLKQGAAIDPDAFGGGLAGLLSLDAHGIYGSQIWILYSDICKRNLPKMVATLRAVQLGIESESVLKSAIQNNGDGLDVDALFIAVCQRLPNFAAANALEVTVVE